MKNSKHGLNVIHVVVGLCLSVVAVGCGGGQATSPGQVGTSEPTQPKEGDPGTVQAVKAIDNGALTAGVLDTAGQFEGQLLANAGGVNGSSSPSTAGVSSAATMSDTSLMNQPSKNSAASNPSLKPMNLGLGSGTGSTGSSGGPGSSGGSVGGAGGGSKQVASNGAGLGAESAAGSGAAATAAASRGGGAGRSGSGGGGGKSISDMFGSGGSEIGGGSRSDAFGAKAGDVSPLGSEDPSDYFTRLGMGDNIFKIVERRYRNQAVTWARNAVDSVTSKSRVP